MQRSWLFAAADDDAAIERAADAGADVLILDLEDQARTNLYHAADVFLTLSDNLQETFGLTVIEAMTAGLPVVANDWNGYKSL